ncbi:MAG: asparagine synthetase B [Ichthyobacteriaceae bacterium]|nr:asparagine synthetase B [Ichthyobacteriaceae bacterium]
MKLKFTIILLLLISNFVHAKYIIVTMDNKQSNHLKAYGVTYWAIEKAIPSWWLLNYKGGSFLYKYSEELQFQCSVKSVSFKIMNDNEALALINTIKSPSQNMDALELHKAPKIAIYSPKGNMPWDDAVTMALTYAEIPYDVVYDDEVLADGLAIYDWLHLHHEDFTGQYGKFWSSFKQAPWYVQRKSESEERAKKLGYSKVSIEKLNVAKKIKEFVAGGGFMFAMCSATDSFDIALAAEGNDICEPMFDGDESDAGYNNKLNYNKCMAFKDFTLVTDPGEYEFSNLDTTTKRKVKEERDYFMLFEFSAKWDPVPTILTQNHKKVIKGFMGQTTAFDRSMIKSNVLVLGENKEIGEARYIHGSLGKGMWTFYGGHDPEDYRHRVGDPKTELKNHPNSPGYRLILNNILFPSVKKKPQKT